MIEPPKIQAAHHRTQPEGSPHGPWIATRFRKQYHFLEPQLDQVILADVAEALHRITRYNGHADTTVLHHSMLCAAMVSTLAPPTWTPQDVHRMRLHLLLHDAHEAYLGDATSPFQAAMAELCPAYKTALKRLVVQADTAIYCAVLRTKGYAVAQLPDIQPTSAEREWVKFVDLLALDVEARLLFGEASTSAWAYPYAVTSNQWPLFAAAHERLYRARPADWSEAVHKALVGALKGKP